MGGARRAHRDKEAHDQAEAGWHPSAARASRWRRRRVTVGGEEPSRTVPAGWHTRRAVQHTRGGGANATTPRRGERSPTLFLFKCAAGAARSAGGTSADSSATGRGVWRLRGCRGAHTPACCPTYRSPLSSCGGPAADGQWGRPRAAAASGGPPHRQPALSGRSTPPTGLCGHPPSVHYVCIARPVVCSVPADRSWTPKTQTKRERRRASRSGGHTNVVLEGLQGGQVQPARLRPAIQPCPPTPS